MASKLETTIKKSTAFLGSIFIRMLWNRKLCTYEYKIKICVPVCNMKNAIHWCIKIYTVSKLVNNYHYKQQCFYYVQQCHYNVLQTTVSSFELCLTYSAYYILANTYKPHILKHQLLSMKQTKKKIQLSYFKVLRPYCSLPVFKGGL